MGFLLFSPPLPTHCGEIFLKKPVEDRGINFFGVLYQMTGICQDLKQFHEN